MSSKRFTIVLGSLIVAFFVHIGYTDAVSTWQNLQEQNKQIENLNTQYEALDQKLGETLETQQENQEELEQLEKEKKKLEEEQKRLEAELQAKLEAASDQVINTATLTATAHATGYMTNCGDNQYAAYIYGQESGGRVTGRCNPSATNHLGCYGIGQDCNNILLELCGPNYECQNRFFNDYAARRYASWANAYAFHIENGWW